MVKLKPDQSAESDSESEKAVGIALALLSVFLWVRANRNGETLGGGRR